MQKVISSLETSPPFHSSESRETSPSSLYELICPYDPFSLLNSPTNLLREERIVAPIVPLSLTQVEVENRDEIPFDLIFTLSGGTVSVSRENPLIDITGFPSEVIYFQTTDNVESERFSLNDLHRKLLKVTISATKISTMITERRSFTPVPSHNVTFH